jgi:flagellar biosynthesis protein FlhF
MQTKAYFASSVPAALEVARQELGADALLVGSRPAPADMRQFGRLEVTFAWEPVIRGKRPPASAARETPTAVSEMDEIRRQLSALRLAVSGGRQPAAAVHKPAASEPPTVQELARRIPVAPFVEMKPGESRTLAFIGPPGRGKTTSLIKVAVGFGLARRLPVRIYSSGSHTVGAQGQMARFAEILGTPWQTFESLPGLNLALNGDGWKGLALIDTPGLSPADGTEQAELSAFFSGRPEIEKHLVLRADASSADMLHMLARFSAFTPDRLLFTGLDEAVSPAAMVDALVRGRIPATFLGTGQQIPEDIEEVNAESLARSVRDTSNHMPDSGETGNLKFARAAA